MVNQFAEGREKQAFAFDKVVFVDFYGLIVLGSEYDFIRVGLQFGTGIVAKVGKLRIGPSPIKYG